MQDQQEDLYRRASEEFGAAVERLARAYEADSDKRRDLVQEIHIGLWRSLAAFDGRCSLRTWVYRVAHNTAISHVIKNRRDRLTTIEQIEQVASAEDTEAATDQRRTLERLLALIQLLEPADRQVIIGYLEGMDAASIGEITGLSASNVATKIHRIKSILARRFQGGRHGK